MKTEPIKVVTVSTEELRELGTLASQRPRVRRLLGEGMPGVRVGDVWRFRIADVVDWLKTRPTTVE